MPQDSILGPLLYDIFISDIFSFLIASKMCGCGDVNTVYIYIRNFHKVQKYLKKDFEISESWFSENYMILNPRKCEFIGFENTIENEVFTNYEI